MSRNIDIVGIDEGNYCVKVNEIVADTSLTLSEAKAQKEQLELLDDEEFQYIFDKYISLKSK